MSIPVTAVTSLTGTANTLASLTSARNNLVRRLLYVTVTYNQTVTANTTITLKSKLGTAFDALMATIVIAAGTDGSFIPQQEFLIGEDDDIQVDAAAGGAGAIASVAIYTQIS